jgi:D-alanyl-D-alanine-carboxypeptidase/D-alanyl-D-alanine-endopeptidase
MRSIYLIILMVSNIACAQLPVDQKISNAITPQINTNLKGSIVAIHENNKTTYLTFGESGRAENPAIDENTLFEIGSITKTFTGLLYAIAIQKKMISENATIQDILPSYKNHKTGKIKLVDLTTHRSGLPRLPCNFFNERYNTINPYAHYTEKDLLEGLKDEAFKQDEKCVLKDAPTPSLEYSNFGSSLLGYLISKKMGTTYPALVKAWILQPLNMQETFIEVPAKFKDKLAQGYNQKLEPTSYWGRDIFYGSGAIYSTASDLIKYSQAHLYPEKTELAQALLMTQKIRFENEQSRIGINWFITPGGSIWHSGMTGGFSSMLKIYLKNKNIVLALTNTEAEIQCLIETYEDMDCQPVLNANSNH